MLYGVWDNMQGGISQVKYTVVAVLILCSCSVVAASKGEVPVSGILTPSQERTKPATTQPSVCTMFVVESIEGKWTDLGYVSEARGHFERIKNCKERPVKASRAW